MQPSLHNRMRGTLHERLMRASMCRVRAPNSPSTFQKVRARDGAHGGRTVKGRLKLGHPDPDRAATSIAPNGQPSGL